MPVHAVRENGRIVGWQWGGHGKVYRSKAKAEDQARAIYATGWRDSAAVGRFHLPRGHLFGMPVPLGGSACSKCRFVSNDGEHCGNRFFQQWRKTLAAKDPSELPAPANRYCCDVFEMAKPARADAINRVHHRKVAQSLRPNWHAERRFRIAVAGILRGVHRGIEQLVEREVLPAKVTRHDAKDGETLKDRAKRVLSPRLREKVAKHVRDKASSAYDDMATDVNNKNKRAMTLIGIPLRDASAGVVGKVAQMREDNIRLISDAGRDYVDDVADIFLDPDNEGLRVEALRDKLYSRGNVSLSRARLIATDQTLKLSSALTQARQRAAGVTSYRWSTSQDERVRGDPAGLYPNADPSHWALEGQEFDWSDPPDAATDGGPAHPGEAINCRCVAIPIIPDLDELEDEDDPPAFSRIVNLVAAAMPETGLTATGLGGMGVILGRSRRPANGPDEE